MRLLEYILNYHTKVRTVTIILCEPWAFDHLCIFSKPFRDRPTPPVSTHWPLSIILIFIVWMLVNRTVTLSLVSSLYISFPESTAATVLQLKGSPLLIKGKKGTLCPSWLYRGLITFSLQGCILLTSFVTETHIHTHINTHSTSFHLSGWSTPLGMLKNIRIVRPCWSGKCCLLILTYVFIRLLWCRSEKNEDTGKTE